MALENLPQADSCVWRFRSLAPMKPWMKMTGLRSGRAADSPWIWAMSYLRNMAHPCRPAATNVASTTETPILDERPRPLTISSRSSGRHRFLDQYRVPDRPAAMCGIASLHRQLAGVTQHLEGQVGAGADPRVDHLAPGVPDGQDVRHHEGDVGGDPGAARALHDLVAQARVDPQPEALHQRPAGRVIPFALDPLHLGQKLGDAAPRGARVD